MTEPDQIEFHERVDRRRRPARRAIHRRSGPASSPARPLLVVIGAVAAMGASPAAPAVER